jgi:hypothetical protein
MIIRYILRNLGKSPAIHVRYQQKIIALSETKSVETEISDRQKALCAPLRQIANQFLDTVVFPGDKIIQEAGVGVETGEIHAATKLREAGPFRHGGFVSLVLIACVDYQTPTFNHHQTAYAFYLGIPNENGSFMGDIRPEGIQSGLRLIYFSQSAD